jgi:hypothetical protein
MTRLTSGISAAALSAALLAAQGKSPKGLDLWVIDVEAGEAALYVSPTGQSVLVDSGWPGFDGRDADWIMGRRGRGRRADPLQAVDALGLLGQISAQPNGTFTMTHSRTQFSKTYLRRPSAR